MGGWLQWYVEGRNQADKQEEFMNTHSETSNINHTLVGNKIVDD